MSQQFTLPTETVDLPSKGLFYPEEHPLASGKIEMKYMTAKEEDILTNPNYMKQGNVIDKLLQSMIVTKFNYDELLIGDKNAIMVAARILSYGKNYEVTVRGEEHTVDLSTLKPKDFKEEAVKRGQNTFELTLPTTGNTITFKLLTHGDEKSVDREVEGLQKLNKESYAEATTRLKHMITSINGSTDKKDIREFVDKYLLASDARAIRQEYNKVSPDLDMKFTYTDQDGAEKEAALPITMTFFWPDLGV